jgi:hypothetical protein
MVDDRRAKIRSVIMVTGSIALLLKNVGLIAGGWIFSSGES